MAEHDEHDDDLDDEEIDDDPADHSAICSSCNGSGEGIADGTRCRTCKGRGEVYID